MRKSIVIASAAALIAAASPASAQQGTVKIGLIMPYLGPVRRYGNPDGQCRQAVCETERRYGRRQEDRDHPQGRRRLAPDVAKRLAQELIVRDRVDILGGLILTPNALAAPMSRRRPRSSCVIMNAATSIITTKSPYLARTSLTTPLPNQTLGTWAKKGGVKKIYSMVSDFGPGHDAEASFPARLQGGGRGDRWLCALPGRQSGFLGVRATREGHEPGVDLCLGSRWHSAGSGRQDALPSEASIRRRR